MDLPHKPFPVKLQPSNVRPLAYRIFSKKHGLNVKTDALLVLAETIGHQFGMDWKGVESQLFMENIAKAWKTEDRGIFIDGQGLQYVIREMNNSSSGAISAAASRTNRIAVRTDTVVDMNQDHVIDWNLYFNIINPPSQPHFVFDCARRQFSLLPSAQGKSFAEKMATVLKARTTLNLDRYSLIMDRLSRHESFQKKSFSALSSLRDGGPKTFTAEITPIKNLLGRDQARFIIFGLLAQSVNGEYIVEDSTDYIEVNFSNASNQEYAFFALGMFVVVEGVYLASQGSSNTSPDYIGGCFYVETIQQPPAEKRDACLEAYGNIDFLGVHKNGDFDNGTTLQSAQMVKVARVDKKWRRKLAEMEKSLGQHRMLFLGSDCFLDDPKVLAGLEKFLSSLEQELEQDSNLAAESAPLVIVMTGLFISHPLTPDNPSLTSVTSSEHYKSLFDNFAKMLAQCPHVVKHCKLMLIPGKNDPWQSTYSLGCTALNYLPQKPLPHIFLNRIERLFAPGNFILCWNPVRINYLSQEIVILKDELMAKFKRTNISFNIDMERERQSLERDSAMNNEERILSAVHEHVGEETVPTRVRQSRKLVKTLLDQGNLQPFLAESRLVDTVYEHVLRVEPLPSVLVLNDVLFGNFEVVYQGCKVVNLGRIVTGRTFNYATYCPAKKSFTFQLEYF